MKSTILYKILDIILYSDYISAKEIAERSNISEKTVRNYLLYAQEVLTDFHVELISKPGSGYTLLGNQDQLLLLQHHLHKKIAENVKSLPAERVYYLLFKVLHNSYPIRMHQLESELYVSRSSLYQDIKKANIFLKDFDLELTVHHKKGIQLSEGEKRRRKALYQLLHFIHTNKITIIQNDFRQYIENAYSSNSTNKKILSILTKFEEKNNIVFAIDDKSYLRLMFYISIDRIKQGGHVSFSQHDKDKLQSFSFIRKLSDSKHTLESLFHIKIYDEEIYYLTSLFMTLKFTNTEIVNSSLVNKQAKQVIEKFASIIYSVYAINDKENFESGLFYHLSKILEKTAFYYDHYNPFCEQIKKDFHEPYALAANINPITKELCNVILPDDEIAYIAIHIASAIEKTLQPLRVLFLYEHRFSELKYACSLIEAHIAEVVIIEKIRYQDFIMQDTYEYNLIFTTFQLPPIKDTPIFLIPMIPSKNFISKLRNEVRNLFVKQRR
ncbi:BglG family transcription antiterminator [Amedibacillus sp. YH-ame6]